ncbi:conserved hypothetical protein (plasmid) [Shigella boydii CDC 3083-94]|uniref:Uncharacterized protein n=1 Tax=Shigella boydii serotype 18 (strain CDC 3083-94 / BS512) TaxID=344609 RepID=B2TT76_SHIB3|nr:conserved hypothetical protein [Shigella boydii CDC 3083-94]
MAHILALPLRHNRSYIAFINGLNLRPHNEARYSFARISGGPIFDSFGHPLTEVPEYFSTGTTPKNAAACSRMGN